MKVSKEIVTPKKAMEWLKRNVHNRPLGQSHVNRLAGAMKAGTWKVNGETIKFNGNGDLIDGQHRLNACVTSGVQFESYVVTGLEHEAFDTIDQGKLRTASDVLARRGEKSYCTLSAAVRIVHMLKTTGTMSRLGVRADEIVSCLEANQGLRQSCEYILAFQSRIVQASIAIAMHYLFREKDEDRAGTFWTRVLGGEGLTNGMPEYRLRERLIGNKAASAKLDASDIIALTIKAWNFAKASKSIKSLGYSDREEFPVIQ